MSRARDVSPRRVHSKWWKYSWHRAMSTAVPRPTPWWSAHMRKEGVLTTTSRFLGRYSAKNSLPAARSAPPRTTLSPASAHTRAKSVPRAPPGNRRRAAPAPRSHAMSIASARLAPGSRPAHGSAANSGAQAPRHG